MICCWCSEKFRAATQAERLEALVANTTYIYKLAEGFITDETKVVEQKATNGRVNFSDLPSETQEVVKLISAAQEAWQEVAKRCCVAFFFLAKKYM